MRITTKGQVTIPQDIRERFGLLPHTEVEFVVEGETVLLCKANGETCPSPSLRCRRSGEECASTPCGRQQVSARAPAKVRARLPRPAAGDAGLSVEGEDKDSAVSYLPPQRQRRRPARSQGAVGSYARYRTERDGQAARITACAPGSTKCAAQPISR